MASTMAPFIGIDFGTSKSVIARYDIGTGRAEIIRNQEGREETPSVVYLGRSESEVIVGEVAERKLDEIQVDQNRFIISVKRNLLSAPTKVLDGHRVYRPVDVAGKILGKLRDDASRLRFQGEAVKRAVITHPASFNQLQQDKIREAARLAGFEEVQLLAEPVAAAIACSRSGLTVGKHILVYDFGGGTFDVAVLASEFQSFEVALAPRGLPNCGGDDLDRKLYDYCEEVALNDLKRRISLTNDIDLRFLRECRKRKENLSSSNVETFSWYLTAHSSVEPFIHTLKRATFEERIKEDIQRTVTLTQDITRDASERHCRVDTVILIGGSSRVPMVLRSLSTSLPVQPQEWEQRDFAVALGAAYFAQQVWGSKTWGPPPRNEATAPPPPPPPPLPPYEQYRRALMDRWVATRRLTPGQVNELAELAHKLGVSRETAATIEAQLMGQTKENFLMMQEAHRNARLDEYRRTVAGLWKGKGLTQSSVNFLAGQAQMFTLTPQDAAEVERYVMGDTKETIMSRTPQAPKWVFTPVKIFPLLLFLFSAFACIGSSSTGTSGGVLFALLVMLPLIVFSVVWFFRKPKKQIQPPIPQVKS